MLGQEASSETPTRKYTKKVVKMHVSVEPQGFELWTVSPAQFVLKVDSGSHHIRKRDASPSPRNTMATFGWLRRLALIPHSYPQKPRQKWPPCLRAAKHKGLAAVFAADEVEGFSASCAHQSTFNSSVMNPSVLYANYPASIFLSEIILVLCALIEIWELLLGINFAAVGQLNPNLWPG